MRRILPALAALVVGLIVLLDFFLENPLLDAIGTFLLEGAVIIGCFALILGLWNLFQTHERRIRKRERGWGASAIVLISASGSLLLGLLAWQTPAMNWFYRYLLFPLEASAGALLAFTIVGAALRVWRLGTVQGSLLLLVGLVVLLGTLPLGSGSPAMLGAVRDWVMDVPVLAAMRGALLGIAMGIMATGLRVLLWVDRPYE